MSDTGNIPAAMVEAAAKALREYDRAIGQRSYAQAVRAALAAAFAECEVTERWQAVVYRSGGVEAHSPLGFSKADLGPWVERWAGHAVPEWRRCLKITTPPVVVTPAQEGQAT